MTSHISTDDHSVCESSPLQQALDIVEALPIDAQVTLVTIIQQRLQQRRWAELKQTIQKVEQEYDQGQFHRGTVADLMAELGAE